MTEHRVLVDCDDDCGAFEEPETIEEFRSTLEHYKNHQSLGGCSHGM
jgi:hypothetical protein